MTETVLLAGATGMLGSRIAHRLLAQPEARVRLLVRDVASKKAILNPFAAKGAELIEGDLADPASLDRATQGVDVIVSAVQVDSDTAVFLNGYTPAGLELAVIENAMPAPERVIPPPGATPPPKLTPEQYRRYGMDNAPGPNPLAPDAH